jgi:predicted DNA-binding protein with PD1-like motif
MIFGGLEIVALHHLGAWLGTHLATGAAQGALHAGHAIATQATQNVGEVVFQHVATEAGKNVVNAAGSNFWSWVGDLF